MGYTIAAGLLAGVVLALFFVVYVLVRRQALVVSFKGMDDSIAQVPDRALSAIILASFVGASLLFGALAGLVYGWVASGGAFAAIALGLAGIFSILAVVSRTPLVADKIVWNFAVGGVLGVLVPLFVSM